MSELDEKFIRMTIENSKKIADGNNEPFTAILVDDKGNVVGTGENKINSESDPTAHSELVLIRQFCRDNKVLDLSNYTLYANGEPCAMCATLIGWTNISKLVYSVSTSTINKMHKPGSISFNLSAKDALSYGTSQVEVIGPVLEDEGKIIFEQWFEKNK